MNVAAEPVELGDRYGAALARRFAQSSSKLRAPLHGIAALARLDLHEDAGQLKALRCSEARKGLSLCFDPTNDVADHFGRALLALGPLGMFRVLPLSGASAG